MSKLTIHMESDWHVGSGTGRPGNVDRLIQRDTDGLPYIPAKTLTGILRDGCELVAYGLDEDAEAGTWHQWIKYLFGDQPALADRQNIPAHAPIAAALAVRSAHLPPDLRNALKDRPEMHSALTFVKPGVAIDYDLGTAKPDHLRFEEMARGGAHLEAPYNLNLVMLDQPQQQAAKALLVAGAAMVERLGAKRRRGGGRCCITLAEEMTGAEAIEQLEQEAPAPPETRRNQDGDQLHQAAPLQQDIGKNRDTWYYIELQLETQSPVIVHSRTQGNLVSTLDYIPGTALLPILAKTLGRAIDLSKAIKNNQLAIGNATPEVFNQQGRVMPFALFQEKQNDQKIYNRLGEAEQDQKFQLKGMRSGYVVNVSATEFSTQKITTAVATHNSVDDGQQRPNEQTGGVYSYEAIPAQTKLRSVIKIQNAILPPKAAKQILDKLVGENIEVGRSKKDDYGLVKVAAIKELPAQVNSHSKIPSGGELRVWLLSDVLIRNDRLRPSTSPQDFGQCLGDKLGVKLILKDNVLAVLARSKRIDSWQTRWGLPRPSLVGLSAGSCFLFTTDQEISGQQLQDLEMTGLGERTVEGYGQLCFNDQLLMNQKPQLKKIENNQEGDNAEPQRRSISPSSPLLSYVHTIEKAAWRTAIYRQAASLAANKNWRKDTLGIEIKEEKDGKKASQPTMSQLGVLHSIVMSLDSTNPSAFDPNNWNKEKWPDKLEKIKELLNNSDQVWKSLEGMDKELLNNSDQVWKSLERMDLEQLVITADGLAKLKQDLWIEALQVLVLSCIRAHKRDCEPSIQPEEHQNG